MKLFINVFIFAALASSCAVRAQALESWSDFQKIISQNRISTIDELLALLPSEYTDNYTLVYRTRALHQERVSASRPRVLLFGPDGKFVIAYNSHVTGGQARPGDVESIETLEFNPVSGQSYLREVEFNGQIPNLSKVTANPQKCTACHGQSPRGLWDPYNSWAGVYGSLSREGIDFIKLGTTEHTNFLTFLAEKPNNPRYRFLKLTTQNMSQLPDSAFIRGFDPTKMNDALTFTNGESSLPNQALGMYLADYNFVRIGNMLADQNAKKRAAFQYLVKGMSLDEGFAQPDIDPMTNTTNLTAKQWTCLAKIADFLPATMPKIDFTDFGNVLLEKLRADYAVRKGAVEVDNMGLTKLGAGYDPTDPYDENRGPRGLEFDSVNTATKFQLDPTHLGLTGNAALFYLVYLMDIPSQDLSTAVTRGTNFQVDSHYVLSGSTNLYYGNASRCFNGGTVKSAVHPYDIKHYCFSEGVEEFFTHYLPARFYTDPQIDNMTCDQLAVKSRAALEKVFN